MEKTTYKSDKIKVEKLERKKGIFETEQGNKINYTNYYVYFKHENNPLLYKAKVDKLFGEYMDEILSDAVAESDPASDFWDKQ